MSRLCPPVPRAGRSALLGVAAALTTTVLLASCTPVPPESRDPETTPAITQGPATTDPTTHPPTPAVTTTGPLGRTPEVTRSPTTEHDSTSLEDAVIEPEGVGPIQIGMSLSEARAHGWAARSEVCDRWDASPDLVAKGLSLTFVDDQLYEIWVHEPEFATEAGIQVGDRLPEVKEAYGSRLRTELRDGGGGLLPAWFVVEGEHELLFVERDSGRDEQIKSILARTHGTDVIEGC